MLLITILLIIVFATIIISKFVVDSELQPLYWLIVFLVLVSVTNIYMTFHYYIKLRNEPGIMGERGDPGISGSKGSNGVCMTNTSEDAITNCRELLKNIFEERVPDYRLVRNKERDSNKLSGGDKDIKRQIEDHIQLIEPLCKSGDYDITEIISEVKASLTN
jgi:hypothetical protein